ncbi:MAG: class A beta-lactamase-related serine hydrolase [Kaiparowitsia implicata GSE-PSE-MK54-09C]|nr:class A beta-lactamase-related serine hydrolase [Kaiparowitsia implicata GSE-PSE-MK54-09C]
MPGRSRSAQHPAVQLAPVPRRRPRRRPQKPPSGWVYATRLLILGVGVGAIAGTILSIWNPKGLAPTAASSADEVSADLAQANPTADLMNRLTASTMAVQLGQPLVSAATPLQSLLSQAPDLNAGIFLVDLDTSHFVDVNGATAVAAASTIKIPILVAFLQDVDAGKIRLDEQLTMQQAEVAVGSGDFQDLPVGTQFSALETATKMITISDNTATNMIMTRLGGAEDLNQRFRAWGMTSTVIRNPLADLEGTNTTSARDLSVLLAAVHQGDLLSLRSRDRLFDIMRGTVSSSMLPAGISPEAQIAHKTGTISGMVGDAGIVDLPNGKRYAITVLVERPAGDGRGQELVRQVSSMVYDFFDQPNSPMLVPARELPATEALAPSAPVLESEVRVPEGRSPDM